MRCVRWWWHSLVSALLEYRLERLAGCVRSAAKVTPEFDRNPIRIQPLRPHHRRLLQQRQCRRPADYGQGYRPRELQYRARCTTCSPSWVRRHEARNSIASPDDPHGQDSRRSPGWAPKVATNNVLLTVLGSRAQGNIPALSMGANLSLQLLPQVLRESELRKEARFESPDRVACRQQVVTNLLRCDRC